jgi:hypothetical protein
MPKTQKATEQDRRSEIHPLDGGSWEDRRFAIVAKTKTGHAIRRSRRRLRQFKALDEFIAKAQLKNYLAEWRRGRAVRAHIDALRWSTSLSTEESRGADLYLRTEY